jgi:hypothetical protein
MRVEQGKMFASGGIGLATGIGGTLYTNGTLGWPAMLALAAALGLCLFGLVYARIVARNEFLDAYEDCQGDCKGKVRRRQLWRLPQDLPKKSGLPVCKSCLMQETKRSLNPFWDRLAYAKRGEEYENTREGKLERRKVEHRRQEIAAAFAADMDPLEQPGLSTEEKDAIRASQEDPRSRNPSKRGP